MEQIITVIREECLYYVTRKNTHQYWLTYLIKWIYIKFKAYGVLICCSELVLIKLHFDCN